MESITNKFNFKSRKIVNEAGEEIGRTKKQESVIATLPVPDANDIFSYLQAPDSAEAKLIRDAVNKLIIDAARDQFDEIIETYNDDETKVITAGDLEHSKLTLEYIASIPPSQRGGPAISEEEFKAFYDDYLAVMVEVTGKEEKRINNHINYFKKPQRAKADKEVLRILVDQLDVYMASSANLEDTGAVADRIRNKFQKWFDEPEKVIDRDAL